MSSHRYSGGAAVKDGCKILATTFLSLLPPLSLLLAARLSATRFFSSANKISSPTPPPLLLQSNTAIIFTSLVAAVAAAALLQSLTGKKPYLLQTPKRRRFRSAWLISLLSLQLSLILGFHAAANGGGGGGFAIDNVVLPRRLVLALGMQQMVVFWRRNVVDEAAICAFSGGCLGRKAAAAFGWLWWRGWRDEAEVLAVMPRIRAEAGMEVEAADVLGWLLYYLTAAMGGVRVVKGLVWAVDASENQFRRRVGRIREESNFI